MPPQTSVYPASASSSTVKAPGKRERPTAEGQAAKRPRLEAADDLQHSSPGAIATGELVTPIRAREAADAAYRAVAERRSKADEVAQEAEDLLKTVSKNNRAFKSINDKARRFGAKQRKAEDKARELQAKANEVEQQWLPVLVEPPVSPSLGPQVSGSHRYRSTSRPSVPDEPPVSRSSVLTEPSVNRSSVPDELPTSRPSVSVGPPVSRSSVPIEPPASRPSVPDEPSGST
ncbi:MAG: hypothetical protein Q9181_008125 [Wetmoreana brouardii]